jgi:hypothetical protein
MSERVRELSREVLSATEVRRQRQPRPIEEPMMRATEGDNAIWVPAAAEALRDQMRRIHRLTAADHTYGPGDLGALSLARAYPSTTQGRAPL